MRRWLGCVLPGLLVLCCTVEDRPLQVIGSGGEGAVAATQATAGDAGEAAGGVPATGGNANVAGARAGSSSAGNSPGGSATAGNGSGGTPGSAGNTMSDGGVGDLPEGQGTLCSLPPPSCYEALAPSVGGDALIDDFEDGNLCAKQHLRGYWFPFGANEYHIAIAAQGHSGSRSLRLSGVDHAGVAVRPNGSFDCDEQPFDLSSYTGIKFWLSVISGKVEVQLSARDLGTSSGATEFDTTLFSPPVIADANGWHQFTVPFTDLKDSNQRLFKPASAIILKINLPNVDPPEFEVLIDDVVFY